MTTQMSVQDLIDQLMMVEDKTIPVLLSIELGRDCLSITDVVECQQMGFNSNQPTVNDNDDGDGFYSSEDDEEEDDEEDDDGLIHFVISGVEKWSEW